MVLYCMYTHRGVTLSYQVGTAAKKPSYLVSFVMARETRSTMKDSAEQRGMELHRLVCASAGQSFRIVTLFVRLVRKKNKLVTLYAKKRNTIHLF